MKIPQILNAELLCYPASYFWAYPQEKWTQRFQQTFGHLAFVAVVFTIAKCRGDPSVLQQVDRYTKWGAHIQWNISQPKKGNSDTCYNTDEPWKHRHCAEISESPKSKFLRFPLIWGSEKSQFYGERRAVSRSSGAGGEKGELVCNADRVAGG